MKRESSGFSRGECQQINSDGKCKCTGGSKGKDKSEETTKNETGNGCEECKKKENNREAANAFREFLKAMVEAATAEAVKSTISKD